jgi:hypothetical protein
MLAENILILNEDNSKKFYDLVNFAENHEKLAYVNHGNGYYDLFHKGIIPISILKYLYNKEQDFGFVLYQIYDGIESLENNEIPYYSDVVMHYARQFDPYPFNPHNLNIDSISSDISKYIDEKAVRVKNKLFNIHMLSVYFFLKNESDGIKNYMFDYNFLISCLMLTGISEREQNNILIKSDFSKKTHELIIDILNRKKNIDEYPVALQKNILLLEHIEDEVNRFMEYLKNDEFLSSPFYPLISKE